MKQALKSKEAEQMKTLKAKYSHGLIEPLEKLDLPEGIELIITIEEDLKAISKDKYLEGLRRTSGAWSDIDAEQLLDDIYKSRLINTRSVPKL